MSTRGLVIVSRPIVPNAPPYLLLGTNKSLHKYILSKDMPMSLTVDYHTKYCTGWYDINAHKNHACDNDAQVDSSYDSCFVCRKKTDFNPAFYNTTQISQKQAIYNDQPHSVYIAYFGNSVAKVGIMSDSRGRERLYEQGAMLYVVIGSYSNATMAHNLEQRLIQKGLKNSVTKKQKAAAYESVIRIADEEHVFLEILKNLGYEESKIVSNLDMFFFGLYPKEPIEPFGNKPMSGHVAGVVGRYLVLQNNDRYYGVWLTDMFGYRVEVGSAITMIDRKPQQASLF
ncbi:DUF2797 domain-containing protein [Candidatus Saccharibacteria bacterium]|nr:MAG: DUF2797 domain-containing protein [Candidatus Saccharibacteria bacterium]